MMKTGIILTLGFVVTATIATAQTTRYSVVPDADGGVWIFDNIRGSVSKCVRPEPAPQDGNQPRLANPFEFYEDGNSIPHCSDWQILSDEVNE